MAVLGDEAQDRNRTAVQRKRKAKKRPTADGSRVESAVAVDQVQGPAHSSKKRKRQVTLSKGLAPSNSAGPVTQKVLTEVDSRAKGTAVNFANSRRKQSTGSVNWQKFMEANVGLARQKKVKTQMRYTWKEEGDQERTTVKSTVEETRVVGLDCEMVGVGEDGRESILARVSIVNLYGDCLLDKFVKAREVVTDYRTHVSGIRKEDLGPGASDFEQVQKEVAKLLKSKILVGHAIKHDLDVLFISHPKSQIRDTSVYFRQVGSRTPSLKSLAAKYLGVTIQEGEHSSVQDARAVVLLYSKFRKQWEKGGGSRHKNRVPPDTSPDQLKQS